MKNILFFSILLLLNSSCATLLRSQKDKIDISSEPSGADIYVNGYRMGATPIKLELEANQTYYIEFKKEGYEPITKVVNTKVGAGWVILDVVFGIVPVIVDAITQDWKKLDQKSLNATLIENN